ncbi:hypothetical protein SASPL_157980 [Salvia splendens]|uniref:Nodulin homeobox N-terminal domain-containing protein n=1 Tax=Salvia splendens TaxID=180675 RepID=A0A8X8VU10_SALSN|nr:hypothetical protein SASPL_157980 [Salvia splendens]
MGVGGIHVTVDLLTDSPSDFGATDSLSERLSRIHQAVVAAVDCRGLLGLTKLSEVKLYYLSSYQADDTGLIFILLDDVKILEQLIDLVFYLLVLLGISHHTQWHGSSSFGSGSLYYKIVSPHYQEVAQALTAYYKVDIFIEAEFAAVCVDVKFLQTNDSFGSAFPTTEETLNHLCQRTSFISVQLLHLCEAESVSYLEEVASKTSTQDVAKSVGLKVLALLKKMFNAPSEASYPRGNWNLMQCAWQMSCQMIQIFCHSS